MSPAHAYQSRPPRGPAGSCRPRFRPFRRSPAPSRTITRMRRSIRSSPVCLMPSAARRSRCAQYRLMMRVCTGACTLGTYCVKHTTHGCMQIEWKYACIYTYTLICTCDSACARSTQGTYMRGIPLQSQHIHRPAFPVFSGQQLVLRRSYVWAVSNREGPHGLHMSACNLILICNMSLLATNFPATSRSCMPRWRICMSHTTIRTPGSVAARTQGDQDGAA
jgi:hypothetical protein